MKLKDVKERLACAVDELTKVLDSEQVEIEIDANLKNIIIKSKMLSFYHPTLEKIATVARDYNLLWFVWLEYKEIVIH